MLGSAVNQADDEQQDQDLHDLFIDPEHHCPLLLGSRSSGTLCHGERNFEDRGQKVCHGIEENKRISPVFAAQQRCDYQYFKRHPDEVRANLENLLQHPPSILGGSGPLVAA